MRRTLLVGALGVTGATVVLAAGVVGWNLHRVFDDKPVSTPALAKTEAENRILATLSEMERTDQKRFGVPESDGRTLRLLTEAIGARNVVEVGTSTGYSTLWFSLALRSTGGRITTFELDPGRAAAARENFRKAGVDGQVAVVVGDAHQNITKLTEPIDVVFLDADKGGYLDYLSKLLPLVRHRGLIFAHNVEQAPDYLKRVTSDPELDTVLLTESSGLSVTLKKP